MNLILAFFALWLLLLIGTTESVPIVGDITKDSIADQSGMTKQAIITQVDGRPVESWRRALLNIVLRAGDKDTLTITTKNGIVKTHQLPLQTWQLNKLRPNPIKSLGIVPFRPKLAAVLAKVRKNKAAYKAGLHANDKIIQINQHNVTDWYDFVDFIRQRPGKEVTIVIERLDQRIIKSMHIGQKVMPPWHRIGFIGVESQKPTWPPGSRFEKRLGVISAIWPALKDCGLYLKFNAIVLYKIVIGKISIHTLGGPISIYNIATHAFKQGLTSFLSFLAILSIMLAFINILPIPGLDGSHLLLIMIEAVTGKPLSTRWHTLLWRLGFIFLIVIFVQAMVNDVMRILN